MKRMEHKICCVIKWMNNDPHRLSYTSITNPDYFKQCKQHPHLLKISALAVCRLKEETVFVVDVYYGLVISTIYKQSVSTGRGQRHRSSVSCQYKMSLAKSFQQCRDCFLTAVYRCCVNY